MIQSTIELIKKQMKVGELDRYVARDRQYSVIKRCSPTIMMRDTTGVF